MLASGRVTNNRLVAEHKPDERYSVHNPSDPGLCQANNHTLQSNLMMGAG